MRQLHQDFLDVATNAQQQQFMALNEVAIGTEMSSPGSGPYAFMPVYKNGNSTTARCGMPRIITSSSSHGATFFR